jgi:hypothetical protein
VGNEKGQWGLVDVSGAPVLSIAFEDVRYYSASRGLFLVKSGGRFGYVDRAGKWVVPPEFEELGDFAENGLALAKAASDPDRWGYIDLTGKWVIAPDFKDAWPFTPNGFATVLDKTGYRLIDTRGAPISLPYYDEQHRGQARLDSKERIYIKTQGELSIIDSSGFTDIILDRDGKEVAAYIFPRRYLGALSSGLGLFTTNPRHNEANSISRYGLIGVDGEVLFAPRFDRVYGRKDGLTEVWENGAIRFIDRTGETVRQIKNLRYKITSEER